MYENDGKLVTKFSILLTRADLWSKYYDDFIVENISNIFFINISETELIRRIPPSVKEKLLASTKRRDRNHDAIGYLESFNQNIDSIITEKLNSSKDEIFAYESTGGGMYIEKIQHTFNNHELENRETIRLPKQFNIHLNCSLNGKENPIKITIYFDLNKFWTILGESFSC